MDIYHLQEPMRPVERTLRAFEIAAKEYHALKASKPNLTQTKADLDKELQRRLRDLEQRIDQLAVQSAVDEQVERQKELMKYQLNNSSGTQASEDWMHNEKHHPTSLLRDRMMAIGDVPPDSNVACHHIVEGRGKTIQDPNTTEKKRIQTREAIQSRARLHLAGIGINDPANGVYLPKNINHVPHWCFPKALPHDNIHTYAYERFVFSRIRRIKDRQSMTQALRDIRTILQEGSNRSFLTEKAQGQYETATV